MSEKKNQPIKGRAPSEKGSVKGGYVPPKPPKSELPPPAPKPPKKNK
jgi:hypothetical protein